MLNVDAPPFKPSLSPEEHFRVELKDTTYIDSEDYDLPFTQCDSDEITNLNDNLDVLRNDLKQTKSHLQLVKNELKSLQHTTTNEHICNNCADLSKELQASSIQMQTMKDEGNNHLCEISRFEGTARGDEWEQACSAAEASPACACSQAA